MPRWARSLSNDPATACSTEDWEAGQQCATARAVLDQRVHPPPPSRSLRRQGCAAMCLLHGQPQGASTLLFPMPELACCARKSASRASTQVPLCGDTAAHAESEGRVAVCRGRRPAAQATTAIAAGSKMARAGPLLRAMPSGRDAVGGESALRDVNRDSPDLCTVSDETNDDPHWWSLLL